jgi:hypothetical protein
MKFLCVPCDSPMKMQAVGPPERGSLSVIYACPECGYEMAMLTNPFETQLVQSLGVRIGPEAGVGASNATRATAVAPVPDGANTSSAKCPFAAMVPAMEGALEGGGPGRSTGPEGAGIASAGGESPDVPAGEPMSVRWTSGAEARLANIPAFVRPMARTGIERFARERGSLEVDETILDAARDFFGM